MTLIPKEALELALAQGWLPKGHHKGFDLMETEEDWKHEQVVRFYHRGKIGGAHQEYEWQIIALDPMFWQSLGRALWWPEVENEFRPWWLMQARTFNDLTLTGSNTKPFWDELLKSN